MENRILSLINRNRTDIPVEGPLSARALVELSLYSTSIFVIAALAIQFLLNLQIALFLQIFAYPFKYNLFTILYLSESNFQWSDIQIFFVFASGPILFSAIGMRFLWALSKRITATWKTRLVLTWITYLLVNALPFSIIAGVFFSDSFGVAFNWFIDSFLIRGFIALVVLLFLIFSSGFWLRLFLKTSYTSLFTENHDNRRIFLKTIFVKPWIYGVIILLLFNWPFNSLFWPAFLLGLGYLRIGATGRLRIDPHIKIPLSDNKIFTIRFQVLFIAIGLALIWFANFAVINF